MMQKWSKDQLISGLKKQGMFFSEFFMVHEGEYTIDDADWNYKDVPHLHYVHQSVEGTFAAMQNDCIATINVQKVLGLKLPLCVFNYESGENEQTYYTTWLFFILIVQTRFEKINDFKTRVITQYNIGSPWFLQWCAFIIRFFIKRNYKDLMLGDIPMRERRGQLRKWGYSFYRNSATYSFPKTMEILEENVVIPCMPKSSVAISVLNVLPDDGEYFYGREDHVGMRLVRHQNMLQVFARTCMHEGASLDKSKCIDNKIQCPWHGRMHAPLASFNLTNTFLQQQGSDRFTFSYFRNILTINERIPEIVEQCD